MWRRRETFDAQRPLRPWLAGIAFRVARHHGRRRWREVHDESIDPEDSALQGEELIAAARLRALVLAALARLPARHREVLVLHEIDGLETREVATLLGLPMGTVYTRVRRARAAFAAVLRAPRQAGGAAGRPSVAAGDERGPRARAGGVLAPRRRAGKRPGPRFVGSRPALSPAHERRGGALDRRGARRCSRPGRAELARMPAAAGR